MADLSVVLGGGRIVEYGTTPSSSTSPGGTPTCTTSVAAAYRS
ncbi:hypothetical protein [Nonomuraea sp. NPDC049709]